MMVSMATSFWFGFLFFDLLFSTHQMRIYDLENKWGSLWMGNCVADRVKHGMDIAWHGYLI